MVCAEGDACETAGGDLRGGSLTADEVDLDTANNPEANPLNIGHATREPSEGFGSRQGATCAAAA